MAKAPNVLEGYLTEVELAAQLKKSPRTVQRWRRLKIGPAHTKYGNTVIYKIPIIQAWLRTLRVG